jgi:uncharacterized protein (TIRG00374 family)
MNTIPNAEIKKSTNPFKISQIFIPIILGISVIGWLFLSEFDVKSFKETDFNLTSLGFILVAILCMFGRDFGMIYRFRLMSNKNLSWRQAFNINVLNEFTSAVTPSAVGGSSLIILFLNKEGISIGRSTSIMISNLFLDELFFIIICPVIFLFIPLHTLFNATSVITTTIGVVFWSVYGILIIWTIILYIGLFRRPDLIAKLFLLIFKIPYLRKWHETVSLFSETMINASHDMSMKPFVFWLKVFGSTALGWISRFMVVNALFLAFTPFNNQLIIFGRQVLLWIVMIVSPTPGGSGISEFAFKEYYNDISLGIGPILLITLLWRLISYYLYLLLGVLIIPKWIKKVFAKNKSETVL